MKHNNLALFIGSIAASAKSDAVSVELARVSDKLAAQGLPYAPCLTARDKRIIKQCQDQYDYENTTHTQVA